jgi:hypothetical protein
MSGTTVWENEFYPISNEREFILPPPKPESQTTRVLHDTSCADSLRFSVKFIRIVAC